MNKLSRRLFKISKLKKRDLVFDYYPSLPTDLQQPLSILMSKSEKCTIKDKIYPSRYTQIKELEKMGFNMKISDTKLIINYSNDINGEIVSCNDLRGGVSLLIAGLLARGRTRLLNVEHIERGYYDLVNKINKIGGMISEKN